MVGLWTGVLLGASLLGVAAHPMHTSIAEIVQEADGQPIRIELRLFADDLAAAIGPRLDDAGSIRAYVQGRFVLEHGKGAPIPLQWGGADLSGDVVRVRLRAAVPGGLGGVRVANSMLCERFEDQVNVVRARYGGRAATLMFTRGDVPKPLP